MRHSTWYWRIWWRIGYGGHLFRVTWLWRGYVACWRTLSPKKVRPPADAVPSLLWYGDSNFMEAFQNPDWHGKPHDVNWGSHGCARPQGHRGPCWCDCCDCDDHPDHDSGCVAGPPYYGIGTRFFGDDVPGWKNENEFEVLA